MKNFKGIAILAALGLLLAACGSAQPALPEASSVDSIQAAMQPAASYEMAWLNGESREDAQGAVTVIVTGKILSAEPETLDFEVVMDTHSVELNMDLAPLATLTTDTGMSVDGLVWDTDQSGHHVSGVLSFPATVNSISILDGAREVTLTIRDVDAAERTFIWQAES